MLRGLHAPNTQNLRPISLSEAEACGWAGIQALTVLAYQATDPWLQARAGRDGRVYLRFDTDAPYEDPPAYVSRLVALVEGRPWLRHVLLGNEPNIEWSNFDPLAFRDWLAVVWYNINAYRRDRPALQSPRLTVYAPPLAQDAPGSRDHRVVYEAIAGTLTDLFFANGDGLAWHEYWSAGDLSRRIDLEMPAPVQQALPSVPTVVSECGRLPSEPDKLSGLIDELTARYGSALAGRPAASPAQAVTPWLLGSEDPAFEGYAWVDREGNWRQIIFDFGIWGP